MCAYMCVAFTHEEIIRTHTFKTILNVSKWVCLSALKPT